MEKTEIMRVLHDEPAFSQMFVAHILTRNARVEEDLVDQLFNSTEKRLAAHFVAVGQFWKRRPAGAGRREDQSGNARRHDRHDPVARSHFMNKFRKLGFISYNGHLEIHNSLLSVVLADQPRTVIAPQ